MSNFASTLPYGDMNITHVINTTDLKNIGRRSTRWQVIEAFQRHAEGTIERLCQGTTGVLMLVGIPGRKDTGALYLYDEKNRAIFTFDFEHQDTFNALQFESILFHYDLVRFANIVSAPEAVEPAAVKETKSVPSNQARKRNRGGRRYWSARRNTAHSVYNQQKAQVAEVATHEPGNRSIHPPEEAGGDSACFFGNGRGLLEVVREPEGVPPPEAYSTGKWEVLLLRAKGQGD